MTPSKFDQSGYIDVAERIAAIRGEADRHYPEGSFQPWEPFRIVETPAGAFVAYTAAFYRTPDDVRPGVGSAWEPLPGKTNFTRDSELQNAETSAWGRALVAALAADTKRGIASANEIRNRQPEDRPAFPCHKCEFTTNERDAMREHLVSRHDFVRQDDGSVVAPKTAEPDGSSRGGDADPMTAKFDLAETGS